MYTGINNDDKVRILDKQNAMVFKCLFKPPHYPFLSASIGSEDLTGLNIEDFSGENSISFMDLVRPEDTKHVEGILWQTLSYGAPLEANFQLKTKHGEDKWVLASAYISETDENGMPYIIEGFMIDISKPIKMETAKQQNYESTSFWAKMGHGVRTPMNAILGLTETALRENMPNNVREYANLVKQAGEKLTTMLDDVIDYAKMNNGLLEIKSEEYDLPLLINEVTNKIKSQMVDSFVEFKVNAVDKLPKTLKGDKGRIKQILLNLLQNAIKFTDEGFIELSVTGLVEDTTFFLTFNIEDTGRGIKDEDKEFLFKDFAQFDSKNIDGSGLGLPVSKGIAALMGGNITASSFYNVGSIFTVTIPQEVKTSELVNVLDFEDDRVNVIAEHTTAKFIAPSAKVLIVDDIEANLLVAKGLLEPFKMQVSTCISGTAAIKAAKMSDYDFILMDYRMPVMDGIEATQSIRKLGNYKNTPIIALTANEGFVSEEVFIENGFNDYMAKPIDIVKLFAVVEKWVPENKKMPLEIKKENPLARILLEIEGVDTEKGIAALGGNLGVYMRVLKKFHEDSTKIIKEITEYIENDNLEMYHIKVHALKSLSKSIGAFKLAELAASLEAAALDNKKSFIHALNPMFIVELEALLEDIKKLEEM